MAARERPSFWGAMRHCLTIRQPDYVPLLVATPSIDAAACEADRRYTHPDVAPAGARTTGGQSDPVRGARVGHFRDLTGGFASRRSSVSCSSAEAILTCPTWRLTVRRAQAVKAGAL